MAPLKIFGLPAERGRWYFIALGFFINLCMGANFSFSVLRKPLEAYFHTGATESGLPFTLYLASFVFFTLVASRFIEAWGPKKSILLASLVIAAGWVGAGVAPGIGWVAVLYGIVGGAGVGFAYATPLAVTNRWFPDHRGLAAGLTLAGYGISPILTAPIAGALTGHYGPLITLRLIGGGMALMVFLSAFFFRMPPPGWSPAGDDLPSSRRKTAPDVELRPLEIFQRRAFFALYACFFLAALSGPMAIGIASPVAQEMVGLTAAQAAGFVGVFAIFNGAGRPIFGYFADQLTPWYTSALSFFLILLASVAMLLSGPGDIALYVISFQAFWLTMGGWVAIAPASTATFFGSRYYMTNYGIVFTAYGIGGIAGVMLSGMIKDAFGSYRYAFVPTAFIALLGIVVSLTLLKPKKRMGPVPETPPAP